MTEQSNEMQLAVAVKILREYYDACIAAGFTRAQSFQLARDFQKLSMEPMKFTVPDQAELQPGGLNFGPPD